jgi:hypothetical protein
MRTLHSAVVGFKEWLLVCDALGAGRQSIIVRKGGIAEGRGGFQWQRDAFLLFPTHFHQQQDQVHWQPSAEAATDLVRPEEIILRFSAQITWSGRVDDWAAAAALEPFHVWKEDVVRERFGYGEHTGLSVAVVRVFRLAQPVVLAMEPKYGGCRSWVDLPDRGALEMSPVLEDAAHAERLRDLARLLPIDQVAD